MSKVLICLWPLALRTHVVIVTVRHPKEKSFLLVGCTDYEQHAVEAPMFVARRVTLVVDFAFLPQNFGDVAGIVLVLCVLFERWGHSWVVGTLKIQSAVIELSPDPGFPGGGGRGGNYRPQTKLLEGNVFTPVCHSVHGRGVPLGAGVCLWVRGGGASGSGRCASGSMGVCLCVHTPPGPPRHPLRHTHSLGHPPTHTHTVSKRAVRILLEMKKKLD